MDIGPCTKALLTLLSHVGLMVDSNISSPPGSLQVLHVLCQLTQKHNQLWYNVLFEKSAEKELCYVFVSVICFLVKPSCFLLF